MNCDEAQEWITALIDNELSVEERVAIQGHLDTCPRCRQLCEQERLIKQQIRLAGAVITLPAKLREAVGSAIAPSSQWRRGTNKLKDFLAIPAMRPALALALLFLILYPLVFRGNHGKDVALSTLATHAEIVAGKKTLTRVGDPNELKRRLVSAVNGRFAPMGFDLSGMKLYPVFGFVERIGARKILVTVYQGEGASITCFTLLGSEADAPPGAKVFYDDAKKINFYSFSKDDFHAVMHQEGEVICIMVSKMSPEDLLALVRDKARHA